MNANEIYSAVWDILDCDERDRVDNDTYGPGRLTRALNRAKRETVRIAARDGEAGWFVQSATLGVGVGAKSVALPGDLVRVKRLYSVTRGAPLYWSEGRGDYLLDGVRLVDGVIAWDTALGAAEEWVLDYVREPVAFRSGTLATQGAGNATNQVDLPLKDSGGVLATTADSYVGLGFGLLDGDGAGDYEVAAYTAGRKATMTTTLTGDVESGDVYAMGEEWPALWGEVLAASAVMRLPDGLEEGSAALQMAIAAARGDRRMGQRARRVVCNPEA